MTEFEKIKARDKKYFMNTYSPADIAFVSGEGCYLTDSEGKRYLDFLGGIAVNALGYDNPIFTEAITEQAHKVAVVSNYFYSEPRGLMAEQLLKGTKLGKVFFGNSGAEANECAIKLARKYFYVRGEHRYKIVSALHSFHGRTLATVTATGQEQYNKPFSPLPVGIGVYVPFNDVAALEKALDDPEVAAFMVEPIQDESGVVPATAEYMKAARELTAKHGELLILDEVQSGAGRTGTFWAFERYGIEPDIVTAAKGIGSGVPISACMATDEVADAFKPGDHGTTFGANPLCCAVGYAVCKKIREPGFLEAVNKKGEHLKSALKTIKSPYIKDVRGVGLFVGMEMENEEIAVKIYKTMLERGFVLNVAGHKVMRFVPPLIITEEQIDAMVSELKQVVESI